MVKETAEKAIHTLNMVQPMLVPVDLKLAGTALLAAVLKMSVVIMISVKV